MNHGGIKRDELKFCVVGKLDPLREEIDRFIIENEYLGTLPARPTHRFCAVRDGKTEDTIVSAIIMATPNWFHNSLLGEELSRAEKIIARGHSLEKNSASWLISRSIKWMVQNTDFRIFSGYSDPHANEQGKIYQSLGFYYLGNGFGDRNVPMPRKRKYCFIKGRSKKETKYLRMKFVEMNPDRCMLNYPLPPMAVSQLRLF